MVTLKLHSNDATLLPDLHITSAQKKSFPTYSVKNIPTSDGSEHRTVAPSVTPQHALLAAKLLLCVRELRGAGQSPSTFLLKGLRAVDA